MENFVATSSVVIFILLNNHTKAPRNPPFKISWPRQSG
jgi:hypothetical protein